MSGVKTDELKFTYENSISKDGINYADSYMNLLDPIDTIIGYKYFKITSGNLFTNIGNEVHLISSNIDTNFSKKNPRTNDMLDIRAEYRWGI